MYKFKLWRSADENFPTEIIVDGVEYPVNTDYRVILRIFAVQERTDIEQEYRNLKLLELFYPDKYPEDNPFKYFMAFVSRQKPPEQDNEPPVIDFLHDSDVIYTSFKLQYGIDLLNIEFLHWYEFLMLVDGLGENTPLQQRISVRSMKLDGLKGDDLARAKRAKKRVELPKANNSNGIQEAILNKFGR